MKCRINQPLIKRHKGLIGSCFCSRKNLYLCFHLSGVARGFRASISDYTFGRFTLRLQGDLFANIMRLEIAFFNARKTGEITSRLTSDCTKIGDGLSNLNIFIRSIVQISVIIIFMVKLSWQLTLITLIMLPIIVMVSSGMGCNLRMSWFKLLFRYLDEVEIYL